MPLKISRYPQSCPLEITHLGASTTHTERRDFLVCGWVALPFLLQKTQVYSFFTLCH